MRGLLFLFLLLFQTIAGHYRGVSLLRQLRYDATEILGFLRLALELCNKDATRRGRTGEGANVLPMLRGAG
jgi:hypothetical protein